MFSYTDSGRKKEIQVPELWEILCRQKFTKQTHQEYQHYEYSKFRLGFELIKVMRYDAFWHVLTSSDAFWRVLMQFDVFRPILIYVTKSFEKNVQQYEFRPKGRDLSAQIVGKFDVD